MTLTARAAARPAARHVAHSLRSDLKSLAPALALACLCAAACGKGSSSLEGSLSADVSLDFDAVQVQSATGAIALLYKKGSDTVIKVTAITTGLDLTQPLRIDLTQMVGTAQRGAVTRIVSGDSRSALPTLQLGFLQFDEAPAVGAQVSGSFSATFPPGGAFGSGKTVFGNFAATVAVPQ